MKQEHNYLTTKNSKVFPSILVIFLLIYVVEYVAVVAFNESPLFSSCNDGCEYCYRMFILVFGSIQER